MEDNRSSLAAMVSSETASIRSCTGRLCQHRYLSAFISLWLLYLRVIFSTLGFAALIRSGAFPALLLIMML
jgi:hypothetical protein